MSKPQNRFNVSIKNAITSGTERTLELFFLDIIQDEYKYDWWSGMIELSNLVAEIIAQVKEEKPTHIKMTVDCHGGDAGIGIALYNFFKAYDAEIEVDVIGMAGSIASVLMQCATKGKRRIARNAFVVIHEAWADGRGTAKDLRAAADVTDKYTDTIKDIYVQNTGLSRERIDELMSDGDFWMSGTEAVELGFADETYNDNENFQIAARIEDFRSEYKNVPKNLITAEATQPETQEPKDEAGIYQRIMSFKTKVQNWLNNLPGTVQNKVEGQQTVDLAAMLAEPMNKFAEEMDAEVEERLTAVQNTIDEKVSAAVQSQLAEMKTLVDKVSNELADIQGQETTARETTERVQVGYGTKKSA